jgi:ATP sulfurylase
MASLLTIPLELLVAVSSFLSTPELGALRLTCKQIEKSLYEWFSKEFFTKKQFMLTHESLQALFDISKHAGFSQKLSHVIIATNVYANKHIVFRDKDAAARYCQGFNDQRTLLNTGVDREMLTESFKNLKNLQTVGIRDFNNHE